MRAVTRIISPAPSRDICSAFAWRHHRYRDGLQRPCDPDSRTPPVDPGPVVQNAPPVIGTFRVQGSRAKQPPNFADLADAIEVSVTVTDAETSVSNLRFNWSCSSSGPSAAPGPPSPGELQRAPPITPIDVVLALEVVEPYRSQGRNVENRVTGSTTVSLHNSIQEVSALARQFLLDFSDSSLGAAHVMRNFEPGCYGTDLESGDVTKNRAEFTIVESNIGTDATSVGFGGVVRVPEPSGRCVLARAGILAIAGRSETFTTRGDGWSSAKGRSLSRAG